MMIAFFLGYVGCIALVLNQRIDLMRTLTSTIFMGGAFFVLLTVRTATQMGKELLEEIEQRKASEELILKQRSELIQSAKLSSLGQMAGGIAHEINNPIAVIRLLSDQLGELSAADIQASPATLQNKARKIGDMTVRISKIISGLKTISRQGDQDPFLASSVPKLLEETLSLCEQRIRHHGIEFQIPVVPSDLQIECRAVEISQVLLNLLNNAHDAIEHLPVKWIRVDVLDHGESIEFSIMDSGPGIPKAILDRLFEAFFTTKEEGKGTGLGLSVSRKIIETHGGSLSVDSQSKNTNFRVVLPKKQRTVAAAPAQSKVPHAVS